MRPTARRSPARARRGGEAGGALDDGPRGRSAHPREGTGRRHHRPGPRWPAHRRRQARRSPHTGPEPARSPAREPSGSPRHRRPSPRRSRPSGPRRRRWMTTSIRSTRWQAKARLIWHEAQNQAALATGSLEPLEVPPPPLAGAPAHVPRCARRRRAVPRRQPAAHSPRWLMPSRRRMRRSSTSRARTRATTCSRSWTPSTPARTSTTSS